MSHFLFSADRRLAHLTSHGQASACPLTVIFIGTLSPAGTGTTSTATMSLSDGCSIIDEATYQIERNLYDMVPFLCQLHEQCTVEVEFDIIWQFGETRSELLCHRIKDDTIQMIAHIVSP